MLERFLHELCHSDINLEDSRENAIWQFAEELVNKRNFDYPMMQALFDISWLKDEVDITFIEVTPMDENGNFNFGTAVTRQKAACDVAKTVVVEVNEHQPWVYGGYDEVVHITKVDYIVENYEYKLPEFPAEPVTKEDEAIAEYLREQLT